MFDTKEPMLSFLSIKNFAIIKSTEIHFKQGMTTITGETGAGKSILLDALNIVLGARVDKSNYPQSEPCEISAIFIIKDIPEAIRFLEELELNEGSECILRRIIHHDGKNRAFINGAPVTLNQLKTLSPYLISIYGQNAHHSLLESANQLLRLDTYAGLINEIESLSQTYKTLTELTHAITDEEEKIAKEKIALVLMQYQYDELKQLELKEDELQQLDSDHKQLANAKGQIQAIAQISDIVNDSEQSLLSMIDHLLNSLYSYSEQPQFKNILELLTQAKVYLQECDQEAKSILNQLEVNPEKLYEVEQRLDHIYKLARKHKVEPKLLYQHIAELEQSLSLHDQSEQKLKELIAQKDVLQQSYLNLAKDLSNKRQIAAKAFAKEIETHIHKLNIPKGEFYVKLTPSKTQQATGIDHCEFLINFNTGQQAAVIDKVASGGELSRIGLAIHVVSSKKIAPPTIIFDEVDVGISGGTAEIVGKLLKQVSQNAQILCITHQAQVSIQGDQQLHIVKKHLKDHTVSEIIELDKNQRIHETARIIGGVEMTDKTLQHAKEMYELYHLQ
ncbi:DNA repair protein RecN [Fastidiosibacter lacustris]|uniref:DNA repair protein RecN n=1 Tax=Fastidiosibacter lacustris TaxID=2056695 RepID=UPI001864FCD5|nr:DNA repair protein RecN [Fastidiosibacter lacustris]